MINEKQKKELSRELVSDSENYISAFRKNLFMYIDRKDITLAELAESADMPVSTLRSFLYGYSNDCYVSTVVKLSRALGVSCDELLGAETICEETRQSIQMLRQMPKRFTQFLRWEIRYFYNMLKNDILTEHTVEIMETTCKHNGNMMLTNNMETLDISHLPDDLRPKIMLGIKICCNYYEPYYYEGDILLIANDRSPRASEHIVANVSDNIWILNCKEEIRDGKKTVSYYSIRDGKRRPVENEKGFVLGYVANVIRNME